MKQFWITFFGSIVGVIVGSLLTVILMIFLIVGMIQAAASSSEGAALPSGRLVLELDLRENRLDQPARSPFAFAAPLPMVDVVRALERAESDSRVAGLFIRANEFGMSPGAAEELRAAIAAFRESGRFVHVHAQGFEGTSVLGYFAVSGADEIWLQDTASFSPSGLATETMFFGGAFEQFGAQPQFHQFHEFKNAANVYTETGFTDAHREATLSFLTSIYDTAIAAAAADRGMPVEQMRAFIEAAPHSAEAALQGGAVTTLGHFAAARDAARERAGDSASLVSIGDYARSGSAQSGPVIALIEGQGAIVTGRARPDPFSTDEAIGADVMAQAILDAAENSAVRAIVLRIDSPGGSAIASDQVWDAVNRAREAGKPVVVSMASLAASGGYYIAAPADYIVAHATTLTGSIGVLGGKIVLDGTFDMVGLNVETLSVGGEFVTAYSSAAPWTESQSDAVRSQMQDIYDDFTTRVASGRDMPIERVREIARGRVWTGAQALELGLVDEIGGLRTAIAAARGLAGIEAGRPVTLRRFPRQQTPLEAFQALFGASAESAQALARLNALMNAPEVRAAIEAREAMTGDSRLRSTATPPR